MTEPLKRTDEDLPEPGNYYVSASQLKTWWDCNRKWAWSKIAGLREPMSRGAGLGSLMHNQLEKYLRDGTPLDFLEKDPYGVFPAEVAATGLQHIPEPQSPGMGIETYFKFPVPGHPHIWIRGFKDCRFGADHGQVRNGSGGMYLEKDGRPHVQDHKSCGNWEYALTAEQLLGDPQAIIYAYDELLRHPDADACTLHWTYYGTNQKYISKPVRAVATRAHVMEMMPEIIRGAVEVAVTFLSKADPLSLGFNSDTCGKYSRDGCPFQANCNLSPKERRPFRMSNEVKSTSSLLSQIKARNAAATGVPSSAQTASMSQIQAKIAAAKAALAAAQAAAPPSEAADTLPVTPLAESTASADPNTVPVRLLPLSDQPINCPADYQPPPTSDAARKEEESAALADIVPPRAKAGRPAGSKNKTPLVDVVDPALVARFLTAGAEWYEHCLRVEQAAKVPL